MSAPEIRIDQLTGARVLVTPARAERPDQFEVGDWQPEGPEGCPFCEGSESKTPPELAADRPDGSPPDGPGWLTRTVENAYPALVSEAEQQEHGKSEPDSALSSPAAPPLASSRGTDPDMFVSRPATGAHEVIINAPSHLTTLAELGEDGVGRAVAAWRGRIAAHADAPYCQLLVNQGPDSGASLEHTHAQLGALPFVPATVARERERFNSYRERTAGASLLGEILREEIRRRDRLIAIDDEVALICPWASRSPYEMRIIPRRPEARFDEGEGGAAMLARAVKGLDDLFGRTSLSLWVTTAPRGVEHFHWHLDLSPRLEPVAAFEMATGVSINVTSPEQAASRLREAIA